MKNSLCLGVLFVTLTLMPPSLALAGDYVIGDGDVLQVSVWGVPDLSVQVTVRPDGKITIPAAGDIEASGLTPAALAENLRKAIRRLVKEPIVTLTVSQITNNRIYVSGGGVPAEVVNPITGSTFREAAFPPRSSTWRAAPVCSNSSAASAPSKTPIFAMPICCARDRR